MHETNPEAPTDAAPTEAVPAGAGARTAAAETARPRRVVCVGSFDPIHRGHVGIIERAARLFDEVVVAVAENPAKTYRFTREQRVALAQVSLEHVPGVVVEPMGGGLLAEYVRERGAVGVLKGLRTGQDFDYELPMATMNRSLSGMETVLLAAAPELLHVSSTLVKEVHGFGGDVSGFVPAPVLRALDRTRR